MREVMLNKVVATKERPILFSGSMVRAILQGRKTQARRICKVQPVFDGELWQCFYPWGDGGHGVYESEAEMLTEFERLMFAHNPYGQPGERLWVRETWRLNNWDNDFVNATLEHRANGNHRRIETGDLWEWPADKWESLSRKLAKKNVPRDPDGNFLWEGESPVPWEPGIFMPRAASRLFLEITDVRIDRLQSISETDAISEGIADDGWDGNSPLSTVWWDYQRKDWDEQLGPVGSFRTLWDSINAKRDFGWKTNPWVWVVEFKTL